MTSFSEPPKTEAKPKFNKRKLIPLVILAVVFIAWRLTRPPEPPANIIPVSGRLESDDSAISAKITGRVREISVREGDPVKKGDVLAILDDDQVRAREAQAGFAIEQAKARVRVSEHQVAGARQTLEQSQLAVEQSELDTRGRVQQAQDQASVAQQQIKVLQQQLAESQLAVPQAKLEARGRVLQAQQQLASAQADLVKAVAQTRQNKADAARYAFLLKKGAIGRQAADQQQTSYETQRAVEDAARKQVDAARGNVLIAQAALANGAIKTSQELAVRQQIIQAQASLSGARGNVTATAAILTNPAVRMSQQRAAADQLAQAKAELAASEAAVRQAKGRFDEAHADRKDLRVLAPFDGIVATRVAEPGEVVTPGSTLVTLLDLNRVYLRGFIPEGEVGHVKVGQAARVFLDSAPKEPVEAYISRIDPELSFTPENTYFRNDRIKQVIGLKLQLKGKVGFAKPGMPADGDILLSGEWRNWR